MKRYSEYNRSSKRTAKPLKPRPITEQAESDNQFFQQIEYSKAAGMRSWREIAESMGYNDITGFFARRMRVEKRLGVVIESPSGKPAANAMHRMAGDPIDVTLIHSGEVVSGLVIKGTSTLVRQPDPNGIERLQWVKTTQAQKKLEESYAALVAAFSAKLPREEKIKAPGSCMQDLMACYPIGDAHIGMLSWAAETGEAWDLKIAERIQCKAMQMLVDSAPPAKHATIINLGDFFHYDSMKSITPAGGHFLDADSRYGKMIRVAVAVMRTCINAALRKHHTVRVICAIGNHDEVGALWLAESLAGTYEKNPRVLIDRSPSVFHYFEHGACLVGIHHGHKTKAERLPGVMAADQSEAWGRTKHRYWWLGHVHHQRVIETAGVTMESFNTLSAKDAYAHSHGWRARRQMQCIVLHKRDGEVARSTVTAAMVEQLKPKAKTNARSKT